MEIYFKKQYVIYIDAIFETTPITTYVLLCSNTGQPLICSIINDLHVSREINKYIKYATYNMLFPTVQPLSICSKCV